MKFDTKTIVLFLSLVLNALQNSGMVTTAVDAECSAAPTAPVPAELLDAGTK